MNALNEEVNEKIKHLTPSQIEELMEKYYNNENINLLIETYNININSSRLYTLFPPMICEGELCPNCNVPMIIDRKSKSSSSYYGSKHDIPYCPKCNHSDGLNCKCSYCLEKREIDNLTKEQEEKNENENKVFLIKEMYSLENYEPISLSELTSRDRIYLGALLRLCLSEDLKYIQAVDSVEKELCPTDKLKKEVILSLINKSLIKVHPNSPIDSFTGTEENPYPSTYYIYHVNYCLNVGEYDQRDKTINELINPLEYHKFDKVTTHEIWKEIALSECLDYLSLQMNKVHFDFNPGEKTIAVFNDFLNDFSVAQIYGIIYNGITSATRYLQETNVYKK